MSRPVDDGRHVSPKRRRSSARGDRRSEPDHARSAAPGCARRLCCWRLCAGPSARPRLRRPLAAAWTADPDDQFLLDVNIRQLRLGDGVRAYNTPEGTCVVLGDFLTALDVPMRIDLGAKKASGWAFKETQPDRHRLCRRRPPATAARASRSRRHRSARRPKAGASRRRRSRAGSGSESSRSPPDRSWCSNRRRNCRSSWPWSASSAPQQHPVARVSTSRACRRCASPIACGARRRSTSSSARGITYRAKRRRAGRPAELGLCRGRNRAPVLRCADHDQRQGQAAACCGCAPTAPIPTATCSVRSRRPISASATSKASTAA